MTTETKPSPASTSPPTEVRRPRPITGLVAGLLAGLAAGVLGGAFGGAIEMMEPPSWSEAVQGAWQFGPMVAVAGGLAGVVVGGLYGWRRGRRSAFLMTVIVVFWAALIGVIHARQWDTGSAVVVFVLGVAGFSLVGWGLVYFAPLMWKMRWLVVAWLVLCGVGQVVSSYNQKTFTSPLETADERVVQLWSTPLPMGLGCIADHHWLLAFDPETRHWDRWEVMERTDLGGDSWGYLYKNCYPPLSTFGGGPPSMVKEWKGADADRLAAVLARAPEFPGKDRYLAWPGPNCNTFAAWVLREAGVGCDLGPKALGENYLGPVAGAALTPGASGVQFESAPVGVKVGWREGVELHLGVFVFGVDVWTPGVKTPFGRFGFPED